MECDYELCRGRNRHLLVPDLCLTEHDPLWKISFKGYIPQRGYGAIVRRDRLMTLAASRFLRTMAPDLPEASGGR